MSILMKRPPVRRSALLATAAAALMTSACAQNGLETGALQLAEPAAESGGPRWSASTETVAQRAARAEAPLGAGAAAAIADARRLRQAGAKTKALAALEAAQGSDTDPALVKERGLLALEMGQLERAERLLRAALILDAASDWRVHSALGATLSASGKQQQAQLEFAKALELAPDHPSVLNNLALSYALDGKHAEAERLLRRAARVKEADAKTRQNLALLLGLNGDIEGSTKAGAAVLAPDKARENATYLASLRASGRRTSAAGDDEAPSMRSASVDGSVPGETVMQLGAPTN